MNIKIRPYAKQDWPSICKIHDKARLDELRSASLEKSYLPLKVTAEKENLFQYKILVAEQKKGIVGFIAYSNEEIAWLYIDPFYYRKGIGMKLVQTVMESTSGVLSIEVLKGNKAALKLYNACGFREVSFNEGQMPGNEAYAVAVHMLSKDIHSLKDCYKV